jgi:peptidyl-tRNA hydrolase
MQEAQELRTALSQAQQHGSQLAHAAQNQAEARNQGESEEVLRLLEAEMAEAAEQVLGAILQEQRLLAEMRQATEVGWWHMAVRALLPRLLPGALRC